VNIGKIINIIKKYNKFMEEKEYTFINKGENDENTEIKVKESELKAVHKDLLLDNFLKGFNQLPKELQYTVIKILNSQVYNEK